MMIEYTNPAERQAALEKLLGIEDRVWAAIGDSSDAAQRIFAVADEDLERSNDVKTSAVHFLRFELPPDVVAALKNGAPLRFGIDHAEYECAQVVPAPACESLIADLA